MVDFSYKDEHGYWMCVSYYAHPDPDMPEITLLPMIHIGEDLYYTEMNHEMWCHDKAYVEGCYIPTIGFLGALYNLVAFRSNLVSQSGKTFTFKLFSKKEDKKSGRDQLEKVIRKFGCDCAECYSFEMPVIRADLHRWHVLKLTKKLPLLNKIGFPFLLMAALIVAPFVSFRNYLFDDIDHDEQVKDNWFSRFIKPYEKFIIEDRDLFLRTILAEALIDTDNRDKKICIKYGKSHMPSLAETLLEDFEYKLRCQRRVLAVKRHKDMELDDIKTGYGIANHTFWEIKGKSQEEKSFHKRVSVLPVTNVTYNINADVNFVNKINTTDIDGNLETSQSHYRPKGVTVLASDNIYTKVVE